MTLNRDHDLGKKHWSSTALATLAVVAVVGIAAGAIWLFSTEQGVATAPAPAPAIPVELAKPMIEDVPVYLDGLGTVEAFNTVNVRTRVDGELQQILFTEGQSVKKGDLLAVVDPRPFQNALDEATAKVQQDQANLANARYLLTKDQSLAKQNIVTQESLEAQQSTVAGLMAQLAQDQAAKQDADVSLSYTEIRSPIDGRTGIRQVDQGNQVHAADVNGIVTITQTQPISIISTLPEDELPAVRQAMQAGPVEVTAFTRDRSSKLATGTLSLVDNEIDQTTGTARLKSTFANEGEALWPGQFVDTRVRQKVLKNAITIPSAALQRGNNGFFVYVVGSDGTVASKTVTVGPIDAGRAVIASGLDGTEQVVTSGQYRLQPGSHAYAQAASAAPTTQQE
jgi:multidrug efflux system membrane fusion protein